MSAKATRQVFGETIARLGEKNPNIVVLDADLSKSTKSDIFAKKFPERFFEMGIQEANMVGVAAGMANAGKIPFICSFSCFITGRFDQIRLSLAYSNANVCIVGSHAGVGIGEDGYSQQGLEDIAVMRSLPNMVVIQPADEVECASALEFLADYEGPSFIRTTRQNLMAVHAPDFKFQLGKSDTLRGGDDVAIFATGGAVQGAIQAHEALKASGISARVVNVASLKPFDAEAVVAAAKACRGGIVTVEDHQIVGGLGSAVAEAMAEAGVGAKLHRIGLDSFGESGTPDELYRHFGLDGAGIEKGVRKFLGQ